MVTVKKTLALALITMLCSTMASAGVIVIEGVFQSKDVYIQNPTGPKGVGFSVYEVQVNGEITSDEINSSAFVIDLNMLQLAVGAPIEIKVLYHDGSTPKILNPEAVLPSSTYEMVSIAATNEKQLNWKTTGESGELPYIIEQYRWNKWVTVGEVIGTGRAELNTYSYSFDAHAGTNTFRVKQKDGTGKARYSEEVTYDAIGLKPVEFEPKKASKSITFSRETRYEVYDEYGRLKKRGYNNTIDVSTLDSGVYYINYDSRFGETFVKK